MLLGLVLPAGQVHVPSSAVAVEAEVRTGPMTAIGMVVESCVLISVSRSDVDIVSTEWRTAAENVFAS